MQTDPLADFLTSLRNASRAAGCDEILVPYSKLKSDVAHILKQEGYVDEVEMVADEEKKAYRNKLRVNLRKKGRKSAITQIKRESRPGLRRYVGADSIPQVLGGMGVAIVSTSQGVMSGHYAKSRRLGGELLCTVY